MLGLVDYSSSGESSDGSPKPLCPAPETVGHVSVIPPYESDTAASSTAKTSAVRHQGIVEQILPCPVRQFDHMPGQWATTAMLTGAAPALQLTSGRLFTAF